MSLDEIVEMIRNDKEVRRFVETFTVEAVDSIVKHLAETGYFHCGFFPPPSVARFLGLLADAYREGRYEEIREKVLKVFMVWDPILSNLRRELRESLKRILG